MYASYTHIMYTVISYWMQLK